MRRPKPPADSPPGAWIQARRACLFPLDGGEGLPKTGGEFVDELAKGLRRIAAVRSTKGTVRIAGQSYPKLDGILIDLSDAPADEPYQPPTIDPKAVPRPGVRVGHLEVFGRPLNVGPAKVDYEVVAEQVAFQLVRDIKGFSVLEMIEARDGRMSMAVRADDLEALALDGMRDAGKQMGFNVTDVKVNFVTPTDRSVVLDMVIRFNNGSLRLGAFASAANSTSPTT
jgi:hypothetical protein